MFYKVCIGYDDWWTRLCLRQHSLAWKSRWLDKADTAIGPLLRQVAVAQQRGLRFGGDVEKGS
jgi:hypothetical protein